MPEFNIDPTLSVYELAERRHDLSIIISRRLTMSKISYIIEETARTDHVDNIIFSAFQYMSKFKPQMKRYREIAKYAKHVYIFGVPDVELPPIENITYVYLKPEDKLAKEWFVVSHGPSMSTALVTEEISDFFAPDDRRTFNGFWIFNDAIIPILYEWLLHMVNNRTADPQLALIRDLNHLEIMKKLADRYENMLETHNLDRFTLAELVFFRAHTIKRMLQGV